MTAALRRIAPLLRPLLGVLIVAAVGYAVASQWSEVREAIANMAWQSVTLATVAVLLGTIAGVMSWRALLAEEGHPLTAVDAGRVFLVGQLGKYLPGSVWSVVVQMELATRLGVPRARTFTATLCWIGLSLSSALTVGLVGLPVIADANTPWLWVLVALLPLALTCSHPKVLTRIVDVILKLLRKPPLPHQFTWRGVLHAFGWLLVTWLCYGCHLWLLANSLGAPGLMGFLRCLGGFALALGAGIVFIVAPSGAGAREALIVAALGGVMTEGQALGVAVVSRMLFTLVDILLAGLAAASAWRLLRRTAAPPGAPTVVTTTTTTTVRPGPAGSSVATPAGSGSAASKSAGAPRDLPRRASTS
ncbi:lysylphosphatidylglycerol synthase transmembrane domain-containing protein [Pedococcus sp. 5OH_020]|uniref:lysylphosphatidylglycerol synthase transmembrane domain-containing protein n=1 Tax=Pedococcus sp. 5OH_020 TaxID=2989814 RepID=UPI0022E9CE64|nr:lysylphosphatidylglycerol synthase transmembrane domain-containing protein [Pedococcus sp. 5OH_020]